MTSMSCEQPSMIELKREVSQEADNSGEAAASQGRQEVGASAMDGWLGEASKLDQRPLIRCRRRLTPCRHHHLALIYQQQQVEETSI
ncbi:unnamed protein product [Angiostrongylus costaricensis]|uniref:Uncharacterized protein n=1 Tax=Angiostrongylus costaricensis TaxID=334426 RepID=A0A0R3PVS3_ANGCS|nr:unnamed protein product [Angiostrongylus costaricensis]